MNYSEMPNSSFLYQQLFPKWKSFKTMFYRKDGGIDNERNL